MQRSAFFYRLVILSLISQSLFALTPGDGWKDSYSQDGQCYCYTTFDHNIGGLIVDTPAGNKTVLEVCEAIGPGPGLADNPVYNDVQCGNGPANDAGDETECPGRVDMGAEGCFVIGPLWNLEAAYPSVPAPPVDQQPDPNPQSPPVPDTEVTDTQTGNGADPSEPIAVDNLVPEVAPPGPPAGMVFEAEDFSSADVRWVPIVDETNYIDDPFWNDSDPSHLAYASQSGYVELLPDARVLQGDEAYGAQWPVPGEGPQLHYDIEFPVQGRYEVRVKAFSTGDFDRRVHVGIDGYWPDSGKAIKICSAIGSWNWTGCETAGPAYLDVSRAGSHAIQFSAYDDGFEMDQFVLSLVTEESSPTQAGQAAVPAPTASPQSQTESQPEPEVGEAISVGSPLGYGAGAMHRFLLYVVFLAIAIRVLSTAGITRLRH